MSVLIIRAATLDDADVLAGFGERTFRDAFERDNRADDMEQYVAAHYGVNHQRAELSDPRVLVLLMESDGHLAGFAQLRAGPQPAEVAANPAIEVQRFYIAQEYHGQGLAQQLMSEVMASARDRGAVAVWLNVWERNARAIAFYNRAGFGDAGSQLFMFGDDRHTGRIMWRFTDA